MRIEARMDELVVPQAVASLLQNVRCRWGVAGGWALDMFLNRITREHEDIEIAILREDQLILQEYLGTRGWSFEWIQEGKSSQWTMGESLRLPVHEIRCRAQSGPVERLEVLLNERQGSVFVFRRDGRIGAPLDHTFIRSRHGIPILAPEIVLLYKAQRAAEPKEQADFANALGELDAERRQWLSASLALLDPSHRWLADLRSR
jgi:hypothetical protein